MKAPAATPRTRLWRDTRVLRIAFQVAVLVAVVAFIAYLYDNLRANQRRQGMDPTFDFLDQQAGFRIQYSDFQSSDTIQNALLVGMRNTIVMALVGIVLTLILGTLVGIARLSRNWLVRKTAAVYVESVRNVPPLLVILVVNTAALTTLPNIQDATILGFPGVGDLLLLSNRQSALVSIADRSDARFPGIDIFGVDLFAGSSYFLWILLFSLVPAVLLYRQLRDREEATGRPQPKLLAPLAGYVLIGAMAYVLWTLVFDLPMVLSHPGVEGRSISGGIAMGLPFITVLVALVLYTATHVAEIVRGAILAVPRGQTEAAGAIGLSAGQRLRHVVLPQAFRIATPPIINQFLNLTKNTSLGVAVAYSEAMYVSGTVIGNGQPAIQGYLVVMGFYLLLSWAISAVSNVVNWRLKLVVR